MLAHVGDRNVNSLISKIILSTPVQLRWDRVGFEAFAAFALKVAGFDAILEEGLKNLLQQMPEPFVRLETKKIIFVSKA